MENYGMSSLDLRFLVRELKVQLAGGFFRKVYQYEDATAGEKTHQFLFEVFVPGKGQQWLFADRNRLYVTNYKKPSPTEPPSFCLLLRKHLEGAKILEVRQHEFDRIVEIATENNVLVIELFSDGNVVLCDDARRIIMPLYQQEWKDRTLKPRMNYQYPPGRINPFAVSFEYFREYLSKFDKKIVAVLAAGFGFGPVYAKEICFRSKIDESIPAERLSANMAVNLFNAVRDVDNFPLKPSIYANSPSPFALENFEAGEAKKHADSFSAVLDEFFSQQQIRLAEEFEEDLKTGHKEKYGRMLKEQESSLKKWSEKREEKKSLADLIYANYATIEGIMDSISKTKSAGLTWTDVKAVVKELPGGNLIKRLDEHRAEVVIELEGKEIVLDFRKTVMENAQNFYATSKTAKKKIAGVHEAIQKTKKRMGEEPEIEKVARPEKFERKDKKWFEKFRWFVTSDGFLAVGGKDATSNEVLIKKYAEKNDLVFHSDIHGSPFVVIKTEGKPAGENARKEAAEFTAAYSKAWQTGLGSVDVYCIKPDQVSKQPRPGEYLPKGSFMIYGEREWFRGTELKVAIGAKAVKAREGDATPPEVVAGPVAAVSAQTNAFAVVKPGTKDAASLARMIRSSILIKSAPDFRTAIEKIPLDDFQRVIPSGKGELVQ
jgi:predicted ribosome quality control (RQC) complex YloA/Tae2 family protein